MVSDFDSNTGVFSNSEDSSTNMSRLYGLSDFWHVMFEDSDKINTLLDANAISASDVYSKFLQLTSDITLEDVQESIGSQISLLILDKKDKVPGTDATYRLSTSAGGRLILNRPFLPTVSYEEGVHFSIDPYAEEISFHRDPFSDKFPIRTSPDGSPQLAMWVVDAVADEQIMGRTFGPLVGVEPSTSSEKFRDFLYGLFFLYTHGPDLVSIRKGLNVVLGIPLARDDEEVLSVRKNPGEDQYYVITDSNSYLLPYGLTPNLSEGDLLKVGDEVSSWVEVKDYENDGDWWINLEIPKDIIPYTPYGEIDSYAKAGSFTDYLMRNYLKTHTFLVKVNVSSFKNVETFGEIGALIRRVKPVHTNVVYVWVVPIADEVLSILEDAPQVVAEDHRCEYVLASLHRFRRNNASNSMDRCCALTDRMTMGYSEFELFGLDPMTAGTPQALMGGTCTGYVNRVSQFRPNTAYEKGVMKALFSRDPFTSPHVRGKMVFSRNIPEEDHQGRYNPSKDLVGGGMFVVPLYLTSERELASRIWSIGAGIPSGKYSFTLFRPKVSDGPINSSVINGSNANSSSTDIRGFYNTIFKKGTSDNYLGEAAPHYPRPDFVPMEEDVRDGDYLLCTKVYDRIVAVYLVTSNANLSPASASLSYMPDSDTLRLVDSEMPIGRGAGLSVGSPFYTTRGGTFQPAGITTRGAINEVPIADNPKGGTIARRAYSDSLNTMVSMSRSGVKLRVDKVLDSEWATEIPT